MKIVGSVKVFGSDGRIIDTAGPGTFFGELALVYDVPRQATVIAVNACKLAVLSKANFDVFKSEYVNGGEIIFARALTIRRYPAIINAIKQIADERFEKFKNVLRTTDMGDPATFTEEQVNTFRHVFAVVDADKSGNIDAEELEELLFKISGTRPTKQEVQKFISTIDTDKNGTIDFDEFLNGLRFFAWMVPSDSKQPAPSDAKPSPASAPQNATGFNWALAAAGVAALAAIGVAAFALRKK